MGRTDSTVTVITQLAILLHVEGAESETAVTDHPQHPLHHFGSGLGMDFQVCWYCWLGQGGRCSIILWLATPGGTRARRFFL